MVTAFKQYLSNLRLSSVSRKLYLSDLRKFLTTLGDSPSLDVLLNPSTYDKYLSQLLDLATAPSMIKRITASLRQFGTFLSLTYSVQNPLTNIFVNSLRSTTYDQSPNFKYIKFFTNYLKDAHLSPLTIKSYKSDVVRYLDYIHSANISNNISQVLSENNIEIYLNYLSDSNISSTATIERKQKSINRFSAWYKQVYLAQLAPDNNANDLSTPLEPRLKNISTRSLSDATLEDLDPSTSPDQDSFFVKIFNYRKAFTYGALLLFLFTLSVFGYRQFYQDATLTAAFPNTPVSPNRQLSFQGRLENSAGTPITVPTNLTFKLFDAVSGGTQLYSSGACSLTPDSDGVFSTQIGNTCGAGITSSVFTENANIWLEVTVVAETLSPRQPIASVAYALNSETLQGFPLSSTVSAIRNTVVPMNQWGEIIVGESSPRLTGVSGTFAISAPALTLSTKTGTNGNITLAPDGTGQVNLLGNTTSTNFFNVSNAQLTTGSLINGVVSNNNTGFNLLDLSSGSSPTSKFSVSDAGDTSISGSLTITPLDCTGNAGGGALTTNGSGVLQCSDDDSGSGASSSWRTNLGTLSPLNDTQDLLIGGIATSSAKISFTNINTGTPTINLANQASNISIKDETANAIQIIEGGNPYLAIDTTSPNEAITFGNATTNPDFSFLGTGTTSINGALDSNGDLSIADTNIAFDGATTTFTTTGAFTLNPGGAVTIGDNGDTLFINTNDWDISTAGNLTGIGTIASNGDWTNSQATPSIFLTDSDASSDDYSVNVNANAFDITNATDARLEIQFVGDGSINFGDNTSTKTIDIGGVTSSATDTINLATNATLADTITIGNNNASTLFSLVGGNDWSLTSAGDLTLAGDITFANLEKIDNDINGTINFTTTILNTIGGTSLTTDQTSFDLLNTTVTTLNIGGATTTLNLSGGSGSTGCTIDTSGNLTCTGTISGGTPSIPFSGITSSTNTSAAMIVGTGASLDFSGSGTINSSTLLGGTWAIPGTIGSTTPNTASFTILSSSDNTTLGSGASSINTIGSTTTPGSLTLHGATTLDNTFTVSGSNLTSLGGALTVTGAITANNSFILGDGGDLGSINTSDWDINNTGDMSGIGSITADGTLTLSAEATISGRITVGDGTTNTIRTPYGPLNLEYKSGLNSWTTGITLQDTTGNVGIGVASPTQKLEVNGTIVGQVFQDSSNSSFYLDSGNSGTSLSIQGDILNTDTANPFSITSSNNQYITINAGTGTVQIGAGGTGKLDAGTIDPPYTINGGKFATYMASMTGVKEETTGIVKATEYMSGKGYRATLDLASSPEGSDLWLFSKTTNLKTNLDQLVVLLSSTSNSRTWYEIDAVTGKLFLYSNIPSNISYRLTAPRFDSSLWSNVRDSSSTSAGFILNDEGPWSVSDSLATTINNDMLVAAQNNFEAERATISEIKTNLISPLADTEPIIISRNPSTISDPQSTISDPQSTIYDLRSITASSDPLIIVDGELTAATISARVAKLQDISAENATISGTLYAGSISSPDLDRLKSTIDDLSSTISAGLSDSELTTITDRIKARLDTLTGNIPTASDIPIPEEVTPSSTISDLQSTIHDLQSTISSDSAMLNTLDANIVTINNYLAVIGSATITSLDITNNLYTNSIQSKCDPSTIHDPQSTICNPTLAIQPLGGIINLANNTLIIDSVGQVSLNGDLTVTGKITASQLNVDSLNIYDESGMAVATIDASGSANLAKLTTNMITIASPNVASGSGLSEILGTSQSNATAGQSILVSPNTELTIESPFITPNSLVYLTPTGNTENKVLFVKSKKTCDPLPSTIYDLQSSCIPSFTVAIDAPAITDISFNWWIIQLK